MSICAECGNLYGPSSEYIVAGECKECWIKRVQREDGEAETLLPS